METKSEGEAPIEVAVTLSAESQVPAFRPYIIVYCSYFFHNNLHVMVITRFPGVDKGHYRDPLHDNHMGRVLVRTVCAYR